MQLLGLVWGVSRSKSGKLIVHVENVSIFLNDERVRESDLEGKQVLFEVRYSGKGSLFYSTGYKVFDQSEV